MITPCVLTLPPCLLCFALLCFSSFCPLFFSFSPPLARWHVKAGGGPRFPVLRGCLPTPLGASYMAVGSGVCLGSRVAGKGGWSPHFQYSGRRRAAKATTATVTTATATDWPTTRPEARSGVRGIMREKLADIGWQDPALVWHGIDGADWLAGVYITWSWRSASTARPRWDFFLLRWPGLSFASSAL